MTTAVEAPSSASQNSLANFFSVNIRVVILGDSFEMTELKALVLEDRSLDWNIWMFDANTNAFANVSCIDSRWTTGDTTYQV